MKRLSRARGSGWKTAATVCVAVLLAVGFAVATPGLAEAWNHGHGHAHVSVVVGPLWWDPFWWYPPVYYGPAYNPYPPVVIERPQVVVEQPRVYVEPQHVPAPPSEGYWYYCPTSRAYYPAVKTCPDAWVKIPPRPD